MQPAVTHPHEYTSAYRGQLAALTVLLTFCGSVFLFSGLWNLDVEYKAIYRNQSDVGHAQYSDPPPVAAVMLAAWKGLIIAALCLSQLPAIIGAYLYYKVHAANFTGTVWLLFLESVSVWLVVILKVLLVLGVTYPVDGF